MKVGGVEITEEQQSAAQAVMVGVFDRWRVMAALACAGVRDSVQDRAADRIIQRLRKQGRIEPIPGTRTWRVVRNADRLP